MCCKFKFLFFIVAAFSLSARLNATARSLVDKDTLNQPNKNNPAYLLAPLSSRGFEELLRQAELEKLREERLKIERAYLAHQAQISQKNPSLSFASLFKKQKFAKSANTSPAGVSERISPLIEATFRQESEFSQKNSPKSLIKSRFQQRHLKQLALETALKDAQNLQNLGTRPSQEVTVGDANDDISKAGFENIRRANDKISFYAQCCIAMNRVESQLRKKLARLQSDSSSAQETSEIIEGLSGLITTISTLQKSFEQNRERCLKLVVDDQEEEILSTLNELITKTAENHTTESEALQKVADFISLASNQA